LEVCELFEFVVVEVVGVVTVFVLALLQLLAVLFVLLAVADLLFQLLSYSSGKSIKKQENPKSNVIPAKIKNYHIISYHINHHIIICKIHSRETETRLSEKGEPSRAEGLEAVM